MIHQMKVTLFQLLTIGGTTLWKESDSVDILSDVLEPNGIQLQTPPKKYNDLYFCEVNEEKTGMNDFYRWEELANTDHDTFCWRTYYLFGEESSYRSWLPIPLQERLEPYSCKELFDQMHSI